MDILKNDEHVFIAGMTGSGKTHLAKVYLSGVPKTKFVLDTKGTFEIEYPKSMTRVITRLSEISKAVDDGMDLIIYKPIFQELDPHYYNEFFKFCYTLGDCLVFVDEVTGVCKGAQDLPEYYKGILARGRELNVNIFSATQRPASIPPDIYTESTHWFIFKLNSDDDRKRVIKNSGFKQFGEKLKPHYFYYFNSATSKISKPTILK